MAHLAMAASDRPVPALRWLSLFHWTHGGSEPGGREGGREGYPCPQEGGRPQAFLSIVAVWFLPVMLSEADMFRHVMISINIRNFFCFC